MDLELEIEYETVLLHLRFSPWDRECVNRHKILEREIESGLEAVKKITPEALHSYIKHNTDTWNNYENQPENTIPVIFYLDVVI